jgi:hypothetical protein
MWSQITYSRLGQSGSRILSGTAALGMIGMAAGIVVPA